MSAERKVLLSSFHTASPYALDEYDIEPDLIVSFDSHVDTMLLGYYQDVVEAIGDDTALFYASARAATHAVFNRHFEQCRKILVISRLALESNLAPINKLMSEHDRSMYSGPDDFISVYTDMQKKMFGFEIITCPPKDPVSILKPLIEKAKNPVIDLDIDYFFEFQTECYTPLKGDRQNELGHIDRVYRLLRSVKPDMITVSEFTVKALGDPKSRTNELLAKLETMGYEVEPFFVLDDDEEANRLLKKWEDFDKLIKRLRGESGIADLSLDGLMNLDLKRHAREFFQSSK